MRRLEVLPFVLCIAITAAACGNVESADSVDAAPQSADAPSGSEPDASVDPTTPDAELPVPDAGLPDAVPGDFYISAPEATFVRTEGEGTLAVSLERGEGFQAPVTLTVAGLPRGVTVAPATIAADATTASLRFTAAAAAAIGAEASLTVTATASEGGVQRSTTARLTVAGRPGTLDTTFGDGGIRVDALSASSGDYANVAFPQGDGRIVTVGRGIDTRFGINLRRYLRSGERDNSFGAAGTLTETFADLGAVGNVSGFAMPLTSGKIIVVGSAAFDASPSTVTYRVFIRRLDIDGRVDTSFVGRQVPASLNLQPSHAAVGPNGEVFVAGAVTGAATPTVALLRISADGNLDSAFGDGGIRLLRSSLNSISVTGLVVLPGGAPVMAVVESSPSTLEPANSIVRYSRTGVLDTEFAGDGRLEVQHGFFIVSGLAATEDGGVLVHGGTLWVAGSSGDPYALRFDGRGAVVDGFGTRGVWSDTSSNNDRLTALGNGAGGHVLAGLRLAADGLSVTGLLVTDLTRSGTPNSGFGTAGTVATTIRLLPRAVIVADTESRATIIGAIVDSGGADLDQALVRIWK